MDDEDLKAIESMLERAESAGVLVEVVWSFGNEMEGATSVAIACAHALNEWDI